MKSTLREYINERANEDLGTSIVFCDENDINDFARKAATVCRRRFKPQDVVLISVLDENEEGEAGVAFTTEGIYVWEEDDQFRFEVRYESVVSVDYDSNGVKIGLDEDWKDNECSGMGRKIITRSSRNTLFSNWGGYGNIRIVPCVCCDLNLDEEEEQEYIREMYNFIADIAEEYALHKKAILDSEYSNTNDLPEVWTDIAMEE